MELLCPLVLSGFKDGAFYFAYGSINPCVILKSSIYDDGFIIIAPDNLVNTRTFANACFLILNITYQEIISVKYRDKDFFTIGKTGKVKTADELYEELCKV